MRIAVLMGGDSAEREISLASGGAVVAALEQRGHRVDAVDLAGADEIWENKAIRSADVVFPALHGGFGEDGHLQAVLDIVGVPYALSGHLASAAAMNKAVAKRLMRGAGIPTPDWLQVTWDAAGGRPGSVGGPEENLSNRGGLPLSTEHLQARVDRELGYPLVIKPNASGSSVGVVIVQDPTRFATAFTEVAREAGSVLLERFVPGRELTASIFLGRRLPLLEIRPLDGFYDYENKYTPGASEYLVPAPVHSPLYEQISDDALRLYDLLECRGLARVDFRLDDDRHSCLEINTIPGMTETSLVPKAAAAVGIGFEALVEDVCRAALLDAGKDGPQRS